MRRYPPRESIVKVCNPQVAVVSWSDPGAFAALRAFTHTPEKCAECAMIPPQPPEGDTTGVRPWSCPLRTPRRGARRLAASFGGSGRCLRV
jgi:hypothetical protein